MELGPDRNSIRKVSRERMWPRIGRSILEPELDTKGNVIPGQTRHDEVAVTFESLAEKLGGHIIGSGAERFVMKLPNGNTLGLYRPWSEHIDALELKKRFYAIKILHELFPTSFPQIHAVGITEPKVLRNYLRNRRPEKYLAFEIKEWKKDSHWTDRTKRFDSVDEVIRVGRNQEESGNNVYKAIEEMESIGVHVGIDGSVGNIINGTYVDSSVNLRGLEWGSLLPAESVQKIADYMQRQGRDEQQIARVSRLVKRFIEVQAQKRAQQKQ